MERLPLPLREGAWVPLGFPFLEAPQRGLDADRALLCERLDAGRASELRRAAWPLEADFAGLLLLVDLRSCPFEEARLKCGRAALEAPLPVLLEVPLLVPLAVPWPFPLEVPLVEGRRTGVRETWLSAWTGGST